MRHRLGHAVEHQADTHAGSEQHGEPGQVGKIGGRVTTADAHPPQRRDDQAETEHDEDVGRAQEEPGHVVCQPVAQGGEQGLDFGLQRQGEDDEDDRDQRGDGEDLAVNIQGQDELAADIVLAYDVVGVDQIGVTGRCRNAVMGFQLGWRGRVMRRDVSHTWRTP